MTVAKPVAPIVRESGSRPEGLALKRIPDGTRRTLEISLTAFLVISSLAAVIDRAAYPANAILLACMAVILGVMFREVILSLRLRRIGPATLSFEDRALHVRGPEGHPHVAIPYDAVLSLERSRWPRPRTRLFAAGRPSLELPDALFASSADVSGLERQLLEKIRSLPDGPARLRAMADRSRAGARLLRTTPWCSLGAAVCLVSVFLLQVAMDATDGTRIVALGGSSGRLLVDGEGVRLLSPVFLHVSLLALAANLVGVVLGGGVIEEFLGGARATLLFGLSSLAGILVTSVAQPDLVGAGASAGTAGLIAAWLLASSVRRPELPGPLRMPPVLIGAILGAILIAEVSAVRVGHLAHAIGFVTGAAIYWIMVRKHPLSELLPPPARVTRFAWVVGAAYVFALGHVLHAAWLLAHSGGGGA